MQTCQALPYFYAFTGCDTTSQFLGKGKKSAWESCKAYPDAFKAFIFARDHPFQIEVFRNGNPGAICLCFIIKYGST